MLLNVLVIFLLLLIILLLMINNKSSSDKIEEDTEKIYKNELNKLYIENRELKFEIRRLNSIRNSK